MPRRIAIASGFRGVAVTSTLVGHFGDNFVLTDSQWAAVSGTALIGREIIDEGDTTDAPTHPDGNTGIGGSSSPGAPGPQGPRGHGADLTLTRSLGDYLLTLVKGTGSLTPASYGFSLDTNADGTADHWAKYGTFTATFASGVQTIDNSAGGGVVNLFSDDFPLTAPTGDAVAFGIEINILAFGGGVTLVWEFHDTSHALLTYGYTAGANTAGWHVVSGYQNAPAGLVYGMLKVELQPGAKVQVRNPTVMHGASISSTDPGGWIAVAPDQVSLRPYMANYAAAGLADIARITGDAKYATAAWGWLDWYRDHMDASGYGHDYDVVNGVLTPTTHGDGSTFDSSDSYAATYLMALKAAFFATYDKTKLATHGTGIQKAHAAILSTQQSDGLTWARPDYHVKYLEDNVEAAAGLVAGARLARILYGSGDTLAPSMNNTAVSILAGIESLWNAAQSSYVWALHENGTRVQCDWTQANDAEQQAFAVAFGVATGARATALMASYDTHQPTFDIPSPTWVPVPVWGFQRVGNEARAQRALDNLIDYTYVMNHQYPYDALSGGLLALAVTGGGAEQVAIQTTPVHQPLPSL